MTQRPWTPDEDALLKDLRARGFGNKYIARELGRGQDSIRHRMNRLGLVTVRRTARRWEDIEDAVLADCHDAGMSDADTVNELLRFGYSRSVNAIGERRAVLGLLSGKQRGTCDDTRPWCSIDDDMAFQAAMQAALDAGLETGGILDYRAYLLERAA